MSDVPTFPRVATVLAAGTIGAIAACAASVAALDTPNVGSFIVYSMDPFAESRVLPGDWTVPGERTDQVRVTAARGEISTATFVLRPDDRDYVDVEIHMSPLVKKSGDAFSGNIDLRVVKHWFQGGTAWRSNRADMTPTMVPELLLHDERLVAVDETQKSNFLRCGTSGKVRYVPISETADKSGRAVYPGSECVVEDARSLMPINLPFRRNKQIWITFDVPSDQAAGEFCGTLSLQHGRKILGEIRFVLDVLPVELDESPLTYSIYYRGILDAVGGISSDRKNEIQMRADLLNMKRHGVTNPTVYQPVEERNQVARVLRLRAESGMEKQPLYFIGLRTEDTREDAARRYVAQYRDLKALAGPAVPNVYIYGIDEAEMKALAKQRPIWKALRDSGARIFTAGWKPGYFDAAGDMLDLFIDGRPFSSETPKQFHALGHAVFKYNTPQSGIENPGLYRLNYGIRLWQHGYDGAMLYAYQDGFGTVWNDFDSSRFRDLNFTYPTTASPIDTMAWEGLREGINDVRYISTLRSLVQAHEHGPDDATRIAAAGAKRYLSELVAKNATAPGDVRRELVQHIRSIVGANTASGAGASPNGCAS
jgi:hypothetical protein